MEECGQTTGSLSPLNELPGRCALVGAGGGSQSSTPSTRSHTTRPANSNQAGSAEPFTPCLVQAALVEGDHVGGGATVQKIGFIFITLGKLN